MLQKGKGKAAASASQSLQPQLASQDPMAEDAGPLEQDIVMTTQLLQSFNAHSDTWEALEVRLCVTQACTILALRGWGHVWGRPITGTNPLQRTHVAASQVDNLHKICTLSTRLGIQHASPL